MDRVERQVQYNDALKQLMKMRFIIQTLQQCKPNRMQLPDELESIENSLKVLRVLEYLNLNGNDGSGSLLNLGDYCNGITLSYTAQKAVREQLMRLLRIRLIPLSEFVKKMQMDLPLLYETPKDAENTVSSSCMELLTLEKQRRESMQKLAEQKSRKIQLLKTALELKLGSEVRDKLQIIYGEMRLSQTKANLFRSYMIDYFVTLNEHSLKAIKEIESHVDKKLDEQNEQKCEKS